jgi:hypothetical protein
MGLEAIGDGLKVRLQTIEVFKKKTFAPKELPRTINSFPTALILPGELSYDQTMGALQMLKFRVIILIADITKPEAASAILDYIDPSGTSSVYYAIKGDVTLNASCSAARVVRNLGLGSTTYGGGQYMSTEFEVECYG